MSNRLRTVGVILALAGIGFLIAGVYAFVKVQDGYDALESFSAAQNVTLSYDDNGNLTDRGTTEGAEAIMDLLTEDWGYSVVESEFDVDDPVVNTASEYMYQMATIGYHILHGTQTVVLAEDVEYEGEVFPAGEYEFEVDGRYWTGFDRRHPIEGPARELAWSGTAHSLFAQLGVGAVTASTLQIGLALSGILVALGLTFLASGGGLYWSSKETTA